MWYLGTADAIYQNIDINESYAPEYMVVLAGDHVYKMDYEKLLRQGPRSRKALIRLNLAVAALCVVQLGGGLSRGMLKREERRCSP